MERRAATLAGGSGDALRGLLVRHASLLTLPLFALLVVPTRWSPYALVGIGVWWVLRWALGAPPVRPSPIVLPLLVLLLMIPVTLWATALPEVTWPVVYSHVAGVVLACEVLAWATAGTLEVRARTCAWAIALAAAALAVVAPLGITNWSGKVFAQLTPILARIPRLLPETVNGNVLGGLLAFLAPLPLAMLLWGGRPHAAHRAVAWWLGRAALVLCALLCLGVLVLTQSRGAYLAVAAALFMLALWRTRWAALLVLPAAAGAGYLLWTRGAEALLASFFQGGGAVDSLQSRLEIWSRALYMLQDFPFTGIGMGTFGHVANLLYPFFLISPDAEVPHAHNLFLQVGVDLGFPGLIAYLALLVVAFAMGITAYRTFARRGQRDLAGLCAGCVAALVALVVHGLVDAVLWGTKPAILVWAVIGLAAALWQLAQGGESAEARTKPDAPGV